MGHAVLFHLLYADALFCSLHPGRILLKIPRHLLITVELARASPIGKLVATVPVLSFSILFCRQLGFYLHLLY